MLLQTGVRPALAPLLRLVYRPDVQGRDHVPHRGPVIFAVNHLSALDSFLIPLVSPRPVAFLAKAEYFERPGLTGWLLRACLTGIDAIPVDRRDGKAAQASLDAARQVLAEGRAFGIHPEGSRSRDGRLYRGRTGVAWLALQTGAPVIPVAVLGTDRIQPVGAKIPRLGRIIVRFGQPMYFAIAPGQTANQGRRAVTDEIMAAIARLSEQDQAQAYADLQR